MCTICEISEEAIVSIASMVITFLGKISCNKGCGRIVFKHKCFNMKMWESCKQFDVRIYVDKAVLFSLQVTYTRQYLSTPFV